MKGFLFSGFGVAGLVATALVLISSPATAQSTRVGNVNSASVNGTYTVAWKARGGCNSGLDGSVTGKVTNGAVNLLGSYTVSTDCNYSWTVTFTKPDGAQCTATASGGTAITRDVTVTVDTSKCVTRAAAGAVTFTVSATGDSEEPVKATIWTVVATPTSRQNQPSDCVTQRVVSRLDSGVQKADMKGLVLTGVNAVKCEYDISVELKAGFVAATQDSNVYKQWESGDGNQTLSVAVATRRVFVVQNVIGDAGDGKVWYSSETRCAAPGETGTVVLPPPVANRATPGGVIQQPAKTLVPLNQGRFNVTGQVPGATASSTQPVISKPAIGEDGGICSLSVTANEIPSVCTVDALTSTKTVSLPSAPSQSILEFTFRCGAASPSTTTTQPAATTTIAAATPTTEADENMLATEDLPPTPPVTVQPSPPPPPPARRPAPGAPGAICNGPCPDRATG